MRQGAESRKGKGKGGGGGGWGVDGLVMKGAKGGKRTQWKEERSTQGGNNEKGKPEGGEQHCVPGKRKSGISSRKGKGPFTVAPRPKHRTYWE